MSKPIIEIENISKCYRIGTHKEPYLSLRDEITKTARIVSSACSGLLLKKQQYQSHKMTDFWALKDVSFSVQEGEAVGIIGRNGAGKSTLLKILSQITPPTEGRITTRGRVASLLEVGTGFHPELTGRENIFLNGTILGMSRREVARKFDEIVAFSEIEKFIDTPVKRYSSGMYVRLAFAVAAHLDPEILVIDEVLAVGDAEFQKKCLGKMGEVAKGGRTVLFVSHNIAAVSQLCSKGVVIAQGKVDFFGSSEDAIRHYMQKDSQEQGAVSLHNVDTVIAGNLPAKILRVKLTGGDGEPCNTFFIGDTMTLNIACYFNRKYDSVRLSFMVKSINKGYIYHCVTLDADFKPENVNGEVTFTATFPSLALYPDTYFIDGLRVASNDGDLLDSGMDVVSFQVAPGGRCLLRTPAAHAAVVHVVPDWNILR